MAEKKPRGRPSAYTEEIAAEILQRLTDGESLTSICKGEHLPAKATVLAWAMENRGGFSDRYARAREIQLDAIADELLDLTDDSRNDWMEREGKDGEVQILLDREHLDRTKLRIDTRKWLLTKLKPQRFGDKIEQTHKGDEAFLQLWQGMAGGKPKGE
jgi:hypothetical protein